MELTQVEPKSEECSGGSGWPHGGARPLRLACAPSCGAGLLLAMSFFLPLCFVPGCNGKPPQPLYLTSALADIGSIVELFQVQWITWPYLFGLLVFCGTLLILATGDPRYFRTLWLMYGVPSVIIVPGMWMAMGRELSDDEISLGWLFDVVILIPTCLLLALVVVSYFSCRTWAGAALLVQCGLASLGTAWFLYVHFGLELPLASGGKLALGSCAVLTAASLVQWLVVRRGVMKTRRTRHSDQIDQEAHREEAVAGWRGR